MRESRTNSEFARAYVAFARSDEDSDEYRANRWTFDELLIASAEEPLQAWEIIKAVVDLDATSRVMEVTAAGPLEELLIQHGEDVIAKIDADAQRNESLRELLGGVWKGAMPDSVWSKIEALRTRKW